MIPDVHSSTFVHLRVHSEYSIVDSIVTVPAMLDTVRNFGMPAVAITDLVNLFGFIKFYSKAETQGIKPLCGCDVLVVDDSGNNSPLVLLVKDLVGYQNLTRLISRAYTSKQSRAVVCIEKEWLQSDSAGLIALSGGHHGDIGKALLEGDSDVAADLLKEWMSLFPQSFYLELQRTGKAGEDDYIDAAIRLAEKLTCPVVATNDVRFLSKEDFEAHEVRVCINERRTLNDPRRSHHYTEKQYLRSPQEMMELFADLPEAIENSVEIAKRCNLALELNNPRLPNYPVPDGISTEEFFRQQSRCGLEKRLAALFSSNDPDYQNLVKPYWERLDTELDIILQMGFPGYFLIVMEFIQWARDNGIPVGPGRGSGAGSIVAYSLGITDLDPLKYDLLFERFLNPERVSMPDFDVDFCMEGRDRVIQHVAELYGKDAVSQIITFGTMAAKAVVRDVARVQGKSYSLADKLSKLIPFEPGMTLVKAIEQEPQLKSFIDSDEDAQEVMEMAFKLEGITRNVGKHAGGVVIAPTRLTDFAPLYCDENGDGLVTQFDKSDVETAGLVKFDFLGLRTLTIIDWAVKMINADGIVETPIDIENIGLEDRQVYELLRSGETTAVFQLESRGMKDLIKRLKPSCFEDIVALVALFRPGPLQSGMVDDFIERKHGKAVVSYPHPDLEQVLKNTYGVILYQEQVMQIAQVLANYTLGEADMLRRAMGKKKPEEMDHQRAIFIDGAKKRDIPQALAVSIFDLMEKFAGYGFNKSHSAAYALVSYQTAWLKTHYPAHFMAAVLSADMQNTDKIVTLIDECRAMQLPLLHPNVNVSQYNFTVNDQGEIVYGLGAIKGLGQGPVDAIIEARSQNAFTGLLDFCCRTTSQSTNKRTLEALIKAGALDAMMGDKTADQARGELMVALEDTIRAAEQSSRNQDSGVADLFGEIKPSEAPLGTLPQASVKIRPWSEQRRLAAEKETLGLYLSGHPIDEYLPELNQFTKGRLVNLKPERDTQIIAGLVHSVRTMKSRRGDTIAFVVLDDKSGRLELSMFARDYEKYREDLVPDKILVVEALLSVDDYSGGLRGRVKEIKTLHQYREQQAKWLKIDLFEDDMSAGWCNKLAAILEPYCGVVENLAVEDRKVVPFARPGAAVTGSRPVDSAGADSSLCPLRMCYHRADSQGYIIPDAKWHVSLVEDLLQKLKSEFGKDKIVVRY